MTTARTLFDARAHSSTLTVPPTFVSNVALGSVYDGITQRLRREVEDHLRRVLGEHRLDGAEVADVALAVRDAALNAGGLEVTRALGRGEREAGHLGARLGQPEREP